jgi:hypothetical protein
MAAKREREGIPRQYKNKLKSCEGCVRINYVIVKEAKQEYCSVYGTFKSKCDRKKIEA